MFCCTVEVLGRDALAASPALVEFEGTSQPLGSLQQRLARERGEVPKDIPGDRLDLIVNPDNLAFRAAIALYPWCLGAGTRPAIPTVILVGELDDWTPAKDCVRIIARWGAGEPPVELVTYPGTYHDFDDPGLQPGRKFFDHWLEYNADAAEDANRRIRGFLAHQLGK